MTWQGYDSLREQDVEDLVLVSTLVEELLIHESVLPPELHAKLDSYHADLANAIEAKIDSRKSTSGTPETVVEASVQEGGNGNVLC